MDVLLHLKIKNFVLEKKFFQDTRSENRIAYRLKIRIFQKFFLHLLEHPKNSKKNQSDEIHR